MNLQVPNVRKKIPSVKIETPKMSTFEPGMQKKINKVRQWALIIAVCLIIGYALYRFLLG